MSPTKYSQPFIPLYRAQIGLPHLGSFPCSTMERIVFPELALKSYPSKRELSFKHILVIVYLFGGVSAFLTLLSKTVLQPLFHQLTDDRRDYAQLASRLLRHLNTRLAAHASYVPPVRESQAGKKYVDEETQTDDDPVTKMFVVSKQLSQDDMTLSAALNDALSNVQDSAETFQLGGLKYAVEELSTLVHSLSFSLVKNLGKTAEKDKKPEIDHVAEFKKEIRSIKGSLLSARNFPKVGK